MAILSPSVAVSARFTDYLLSRRLAPRFALLVMLATGVTSLLCHGEFANRGAGLELFTVGSAFRGLVAGVTALLIARAGRGER